MHPHTEIRGGVPRRLFFPYSGLGILAILTFVLSLAIVLFFIILLGTQNPDQTTRASAGEFLNTSSTAE